VDTLPLLWHSSRWEAWKRVWEAAAQGPAADWEFPSPQRWRKRGWEGSRKETNLRPRSSTGLRKATNSRFLQASHHHHPFR